MNSLVYECRLCGQTFLEKAPDHTPARNTLTPIAAGGSREPGDARPLAVHDCGGGRYGLGELVGVERG